MFQLFLVEILEFLWNKNTSPKLRQIETDVSLKKYSGSMLGVRMYSKTNVALPQGKISRFTQMDIFFNEY